MSSCTLSGSTPLSDRLYSTSCSYRHCMRSISKVSMRTGGVASSVVWCAGVWWARRYHGPQRVGSRAMGPTGEVRILRHDDVAAALDMGACIDAMEGAFTSYSAGQAELP